LNSVQLPGRTYSNKKCSTGMIVLLCSGPATPSLIPRPGLRTQLVSTREPIGGSLPHSVVASLTAPLKRQSSLAFSRNQACCLLNNVSTQQAITPRRPKWTTCRVYPVGGSTHFLTAPVVIQLLSISHLNRELLVSRSRTIYLTVLLGRAG